MDNWSVVRSQGTAGGFAPRCRRGFTLIELLVVVAIIVTLIAILVPAVGRARVNAYTVSTKSLLSNLQSQCESYYQVFHAYPGPVPPVGASGGTTLGAQISGTQNLLLGLTYPMAGSGPVAVPGLPAVGGGPAAFVDPTKMLGPANFAIQHPDGTYEQYAPFFSPTVKQISKPNAAGVYQATGGVAGGVGGSFAFPAIVDAFPDALPILYYRKSPGVDGVGSTDGNGNVTGAQVGSSSPPPIATPGVAAANNVGAYYLDDNKMYTSSTALISAAGTVINQNDTGNMNVTARSFAMSAQQLATLASNHPPSSTAMSTGGYVLIGAGPSRMYGTTMAAFAQPNFKMDDIVIVGGQ